MTETHSFKALGEKTATPDIVVAKTLEAIPIEQDTVLWKGYYSVRFTCPEFTSLCPVTGQPDFAHIVIDMIPDQHLLESKSLKLYLASYRNHQAFHESIACMIGTDIEQIVSPGWLRVAAFFNARGGIPIDVFWQTEHLSSDCSVHIAPLDYMPFRGR